MIVPTKWNAEAFVNGGVTVPVTVVPHIVDTVEAEYTDNEWLRSLGVRARAGAPAGGPFVVHSVAAWISARPPG